MNNLLCKIKFLFQQLQSDLSQHRNLVHQLSTEMKARDQQRPSREATVFTPLSEEALQPRWEALSRELAEKRENLEDLIRKTDVSFNVFLICMRCFFNMQKKMEFF